MHLGASFGSRFPECGNVVLAWRQSAQLSSRVAFFGEPPAEPSMSQKASVALKKSLPPHGRKASPAPGVSRDEFHSSPACGAERCAGKAAQVPEFPLC